MTRGGSSGPPALVPPLLLLVVVVVVLRALDALSLATFFTPDEYWQGPEVAHTLVFGAGLLCVPGLACLLPSKEGRLPALIL